MATAWNRRLPRRATAWLITSVVAGAVASAAAPAALAAPARPSSRPHLRFDGNFRPGTFRPWNHLSLGEATERIGRRGSSRDIAVVRAPGLSGLWAGRFSIGPADQAFSGTSYIERAEISASQRQIDAYPGRSAWYGWATDLPTGFMAAYDGWAILAQAYRVGGRCLSPEISLAVNSTTTGGRLVRTLRLNVRGGSLDGDVVTAGSHTTCPGVTSYSFPVASLQRNHWFRFVMHVGWSSDP